MNLPQQLVRFNPGERYDATPMVCESCRNHISVGYGLHQGRVYFSLGCHICKKGSAYAPNPTMSLEDLE